MGMFDFFNRRSSASTAANRLKVILASERSANLEYMEDMKNEIMEVIKKYTKSNKIEFKADSNQHINMLEIEITLNETK